MGTTRTCVQDFALANKLYVNATVTFYTVLDGEKSGELATLYAALTGENKLKNPQVLDSFGKFKAPVYIGEAVIMSVTGLENVEDHDTGVVASSFMTESMNIVIENVSNKTYNLVINSAYAFEIESVTTQSTTGTCTATIKIDGVDLGGGANAVSTTEEEKVHETANVVPVGGNMSLQISGNAGAANVSLTIKFSRR